MGQQFAVSVVICTHNPRPDYLQRVLDALAAQTLRMAQWELLLIDNASRPALVDWIDLSWHPGSRYIREDEKGLTPARLRGISEARGELLVFVDDDNVLECNYLSEAVSIGLDYPFLGVWGGSNKPEFETDPLPWTIDFWPALAIREVDNVRWSNTFDDWRAHPCGAGMCVRRVVAEAYSAQAAVDPTIRFLGRKGTALMSAEDTDITYTAREVGFGFGTFPQLSFDSLNSNQSSDGELFVAS